VFLKAVVAPSRDDDVVEESNAERSGRLSDLFCYLLVLFAWGWISGGVIVGDDD